MVIVATIRALKMHGGVEKADLKTPNAKAVELGMANLEKHLENIKNFGLPVIVAINQFTADTDEEMAVIEGRCEQLGVQAVKAHHWADGGAGAVELATKVVELIDRAPCNLRFAYLDDMTLWDKTRTIAREIYGADAITADAKVQTKFKELEKAGFGRLPICMAKTQYSFSTDAALRGRPKGFNVPIRDVNVSAGAGFVVVITGDIMTMPGLPKTPAAEQIDINAEGQVVGLF